MYALMNFHGLSNRNEHIEPKSSMKGVAADQIKRARQNYWWGGGGRPLPMLRHCLRNHDDDGNGKVKKAID